MVGGESEGEDEADGGAHPMHAHTYTYTYTYTVHLVSHLEQRVVRDDVAHPRPRVVRGKDPLEHLVRTEAAYAREAHLRLGEQIGAGQRQRVT